MIKKKILIVDDESDFTDILKLNLEKMEIYEVRGENKADRVLQTAREFVPDLILMDIVMPKFDGGTVKALLEEDEMLRDIPVVFLTAIVTRRELEGDSSGIIAGHPFIAKPASPKVIAATIEKQLAE